MSEYPDPPVPQFADMRRVPGFLLDIDRLLGSELVALGTPEECWAALMLWCKAFRQIPAGSLPNDEKTLAGFSGAGKQWPKIREIAMRGFYLCSDGRFYHPVVAERVLECLDKLKKYSKEQDRLKAWRERKRVEQDRIAFLKRV